MKANSRIFAAVAAALVASAANGIGQTNPPLAIVVPPEQIVPVGPAVEAYAVANVRMLVLDVFQTISNSTMLCSSVRKYSTPHFNSKAEMDDYFRLWLGWAMNVAMTNGTMDVSKPFYFVADMQNNPTTEAGWIYFVGYYTNVVLTFSNGQYQLPDLSDYILKQSGVLPVRIPGIRWAICETFLRSTGARVALMDSRSNSFFLPNGSWNPDGGVYTNSRTSWLGINVRRFTDTTTYSNKVSIALTNGFKVIGDIGYVIPERSVIIEPPMVIGNSCTVRLSGGDPGRVLILQGSDSVCNWTDLKVFVNGYDGGVAAKGYLQPLLYSEWKTEGKGRFFRVILSQ